MSAGGTGVTAKSWVHAGDMEIAEYSGAGALLRRFVPGTAIDQHVAMVEADGSTFFYHPDRLGHIIALSNGTTGSPLRGDLADKYVYTPFGIQLPLSTSPNPFRYTGRRFDPETGLYHYRARFYDASLGRFLQPDPIGYEDQMNLYAYVANDPINMTDPTGTCGPMCAGAVAGIGLELLIQGAEIAAGKRTSLDGRSILVSGAAGFAGVGLISKAQKIGAIAVLGAEAVTSIGSTIAKGEEVTATGVIADVVVGAVAGDAASSAVKSHIDDAVSMAEKAAERAKFPGFRRDEIRAQITSDAAKRAQASGPSIQAAASTTAAGAGSTAVEAGIEFGADIEAENDNGPLRVRVDCGPPENPCQ